MQKAGAQEAILRRLEKDTYKARRKEGRSQHGTTSTWSLVLGSFAALFQAYALLGNSLRTNWVSVLGYSAARGFGYFGVTGNKWQTWFDLSSATCEGYGQLNVGGVCATPICNWYKLKCDTYVDTMWFSYGCALASIIESVVFVLCLFWTWKCTPRLLRWAATWYPPVMVVHWSCLAIWSVKTELLFGELNKQSFYPSPSLGIGFICGCTAGVFITINTAFAWLLHQMWPEVDLSEEAWEDEEEEDSDDEKLPAEGAPAGYDIQSPAVPQ